MTTFNNEKVSINAKHVCAYVVLSARCSKIIITLNTFKKINEFN